MKLNSNSEKIERMGGGRIRGIIIEEKIDEKEE